MARYHRKTLTLQFQSVFIFEDNDCTRSTCLKYREEAFIASPLSSSTATHLVQLYIIIIINRFLFIISSDVASKNATVDSGSLNKMMT